MVLRKDGREHKRSMVSRKYTMKVNNKKKNKKMS